MSCSGKKGDLVSFTPERLVGIIIAILLIVASFAILARILSPEPADTKSFEQFGKTVQSFALGSQPFLQTTYHISKEYALIAYDTAGNIAYGYQDIYSVDWNRPAKPGACKIGARETACLCLFERSTGSDSGGQIIPKDAKVRDKLVDCILIEGPSHGPVTFSRRNSTIPLADKGFSYGLDGQFSTVDISGNDYLPLRHLAMAKTTDPAGVTYITFYDIEDQLQRFPTILCSNASVACGATDALYEVEQGSHGVSIRDCLGYGGCAPNTYCTIDVQEVAVSDKQTATTLAAGACRSPGYFFNLFGFATDASAPCSVGLIPEGFQWGIDQAPKIGFACADNAVCVINVSSPGSLPYSATCLQAEPQPI